MESSNIIFVFGSNEAGRHGKGAALVAKMYYGAINGQGWGLQGQSFAIPTKDAKLKILTVHAIKGYVDKFIKFAKEHPTWTFKVTAVGTGLAGYSHDDIAPLFDDAPWNCVVPYAWRKMLERSDRQYWVS